MKLVLLALAITIAITTILVELGIDMKEIKWIYKILYWLLLLICIGYILWYGFYT